MELKLLKENYKDEIFKTITIEIYKDDIAYISEDNTNGSKYKINIKSPETIVAAFDEYLHDNINPEDYDESLRESTEVDSSYTVKDYLDEIRLYADEDYVTIEKIEFDIEQAPYDFKTEDVIMYGLNHGWKLKTLPEEGLSLTRK